MPNNTTGLQSPMQLTDFNGVEFATFKLKKGVTEADMLAAAETATLEFFSKEEGVLGHTILKGEAGLYADVTFASTKEKAEAICGKWMSNQFALAYLEFINPDSVNMTFWTKIK